MPPQRLVDSLAVADRAALEARLVDFDRDWHDRKFHEYVAALAGADSALRLPLLVELVKIDLERQWQHGNQVALDSYLAHFPELARSTALRDELAEADRQVRQRFGAADVATSKSDAADTGLQPAQAGRYRVLRKLGQGNMGSVYLAEDTRLGRQVALKRPHFQADDAPETRARFLREARVLATLHHPNLCQVFDVGEQDGVPYLAMAYVEGRSLAERLKSGRAWSEHAAAVLIRQLALALAEAHDRGIVHRDLKPANIIITMRDEPVVVDFGLARNLRADDIRLTGTGAILGTPAYMAPEQAAGDSAAVGPACDIYSLGVILYELLSGRVPFDGPLLEVLVRIRDQPPAPLPTHRPGVNPALAAICSRAMAKRPRDRYGSMRDLAADLEPLVHSLSATLAGAPSTVRLRPAARQGKRPAWSRWLGGVVICVLVGGLLGVAAWSLTRSPQDEPSRPAAPIARPSVPVAGLKYILVRPFARHEGKVTGVAFAQQADTVISGGADHTVRFWDVSTGAENVPSRWDLGPLTEGHGLAANGQYVLTSTLQRLTLWQLEGHREVRKVDPGGPHLDAFAVANDGRRFMAGIRPALGKPLVRVWDTEADQPLRSWTGHSEPVVCVALSSDGRYALSAGADTLCVWDVPMNKLLRQQKVGPIVSLAISPTGERFATGSAAGSIRLWQTDPARDLGSLNGHTAAVLCLAFSPDGGHLLSGGTDRTVRQWDLASAKEAVCLRGHSAAVTCAAFSPAGDRVLSGSEDGEVRLWGPD